MRDVGDLQGTLRGSGSGSGSVRLDPRGESLVVESGQNRAARAADSMSPTCDNFLSKLPCFNRNKIIKSTLSGDNKPFSGLPERSVKVFSTNTSGFTE